MRTVFNFIIGASLLIPMCVSANDIPVKFRGYSNDAAKLFYDGMVVALAASKRIQENLYCLPEGTELSSKLLIESTPKQFTLMPAEPQVVGGLTVMPFLDAYKCPEEEPDEDSHNQ